MKTIFDWYAEIIAAAPHPVVLEIGAADGLDTARLLQVILDSGKPYHYIAFEPEPRNIPKMLSLPCASKFEFVEAAVGNVNCDSDFYSSGQWPYSGSCKKPLLHAEHHWLTFLPPVKVRMVRLDDLLTGSHFDFIWCDVQGAEDMVIAGAQSTLRRTHYFYTEYLPFGEYEGCIQLPQILERLPGRWEVMQDWDGDALLHNLDFP